MNLNKRIATATFTLLLFILFFNQASGQGEIIGDIKNALKSGSSKELVKFLNQSVDVTLDGDIQTYSRVQAEYVLKDFFDKNKPQSFNIIHQGASKGGLHFAIGQYTSDSNTFRVFLRIKSTDGKYRVHEISFDKE